MRLAVVNFVFFFCLLGKAQTYTPLPLKNAYWLTTYGKNDYLQGQYNCFDEETYAFYPAADTVINGITYVQFHRQFINQSTNCPGMYTPGSNSYSYAIRQDTLARKIYLVSNGQTTEKLMYDFTLNAGDSVKTYLGDIGAPCLSRYRIVDTISSRVLGDGLSHKVFKLIPYTGSCVSPFPTWNDSIIEGVGEEIGLNEWIKGVSYPTNMGNGYTSQNIISNCLHVNGTLVYSYGNAANCNYALSVQNVFNKKIEFLPNPFNNEISIGFMENGDIRRLTVYNNLGAIVYFTEKPIHETKINTTDWPSGMYYVVTYGSKLNYCQKMVKQ